MALELNGEYYAINNKTYFNRGADGTKSVSVRLDKWASADDRAAYPRGNGAETVQLTEEQANAVYDMLYGFIKQNQRFADAVDV